LIDFNGYTKLCDFGLSKKTTLAHVDSSESASATDSVSEKSHRSVTVKESEFISHTTFFGTLEYMAPEAFQKEASELSPSKQKGH